MTMPEGDPLRPPQPRNPRESSSQRTEIFKRYAVLSGRGAKGGTPFFAGSRGYEYLVESGVKPETEIGHYKLVKDIQVVQGLPVVADVFITINDHQVLTSEQMAQLTPTAREAFDTHGNSLVTTRFTVKNTDGRQGPYRTENHLYLIGIKGGTVLATAKVNFGPPHPGVEEVQQTLLGGVVDLAPEIPIPGEAGPPVPLTDPALADHFLQGYTILVNEIEEREKAKERAAKQAGAEAEQPGAFHIQGPETPRSRGGSVYFAGDGEDLQQQDPRDGDGHDSDRGGESR